MTELAHLAQAIVRFGVGSFSFLEMAWLVIGLVCLKDTSCAFLDARQQLQAATMPPVDDVQRLLATIDHRLALEAVAVQVAFVLIGLVAAVRSPPPPSESDGAALAEIAIVALLVGVQGMHLVGSHERRRYLAEVDRRIRATKIAGGRRATDPPLAP